MVMASGAARHGNGCLARVAVLAGRVYGADPPAIVVGPGGRLRRGWGMRGGHQRQHLACQQRGPTRPARRGEHNHHVGAATVIGLLLVCTGVVYTHLK